MRYVIVGAGAIGGTIGGRLADSGRSVLLVARGAHGEALRRDGLRLALPDRLISVRVPIVASVADLVLTPDDVLVVAVKSHDSAIVLEELARLPVGMATAGETLPVFCFQNGTNNELVALRFFAHVHGVCVALPATYLEPGHVDAHGSPVSGVLEVGRYPHGTDRVDERVVADLVASGFLATVRADVMAWKRSKLLQNLGNALEPLCGHYLSDFEMASRTQVVRSATQEGLECFASAGLTVVGDMERNAHLSGRMGVLPAGGRPRAGGSTWQSVVRGIGSVETDFLNGEIVLLGRLNGIATPINDELQKRMTALVQGRQSPQTVLPSELIAAIDCASAVGRD